MTTNRQPTCEERVAAHRDDRIEDLRKLWTAYCEDDEDRHSDDIGNLFEYGLSFDYVPAGTFGDQDQGYFRYQISWGGPSEEFRFYTDADRQCHAIEFWFLDWGDGASRTLYDEDRDLLLELWRWFEEMGSVEAEYNKAVAQ
jgi:hypothetical protein